MVLMMMVMMDTIFFGSLVLTQNFSTFSFKGKSGLSSFG